MGRHKKVLISYEISVLGLEREHCLKINSEIEWYASLLKYRYQKYLPVGKITYR